MAIVAPIAGALAGSLFAGAVGLTGTAATIATSIGWLAGTALYMSMNRPKPTVTDPGAQQFVPINQSVRGLAIPILFGTNRVNSMIVFQGNFRTDKYYTVQKSGSSFQQQKTFTANYAYSVDQIFHFGMPLAPVTIVRGWVDDKPIAPDSISALTGGVTSLISLFSGTSYVPGGSNIVTLQYTSAFFSDGDFPITYNTNLEYFRAALGASITWAGTSYLAIHELSLGGATYIPTLSFEIGPAVPSLTENPELVWFPTYDVDSIMKFVGWSAYGDAIWISHTVGVGDDGDARYIYFNNNDGSQVRFLSSDISTAAGGTSTTFCSGCLANNGQYLVLMGINGTDTRCIAVLELGYQTYTTVGFSERPGTNGGGLAGGISWPAFSNYDNMHHGGTQALTDYIWLVTNLDGWPVFWRIGTLAEYIGVFNYTGSPISNVLTYNWGYGAGTNRYFQGSGITLDFPHSGWVLNLDDGAGGNIDYYVMWVGSSLINSGVSTFYNSIAATYPNGCFVGIPLDLSTTTWTVVNDLFLDSTNTGTYLPSADEGLGYTATSNPLAIYRDWSMPVQMLANAYRAFILIKYDQVSGDLTTEDHYQIRVYIWKAGTNKAVQYINDWVNPHNHGDFNVGGGASYINAMTAAQVLSDSTVWVAMHGNYSGPGYTTKIQNIFLNMRVATLNFGDYDLTPPEIIREILAHPYFGLGYSYDDIDSASYTDAVAYCTAREILVSTQYRATGSALATIEQLLQIYNGYMTIDAGLGSIKFGITEYTGTSVRTIDNNHLLIDRDGTPPVSVTKGALQDTINKVRISYQDRLLDYKQNQVEESDEVDQDLHGVRLKEFPPQFVMKQTTARRMALTTLMHNMYMRDIYDFKVGWKDADLEPGDVITLVDSFSSLSTVCRIVKWQEKKRGEFSVTAQQETQYILQATVSSEFNSVSSVGVIGDSDAIYAPFYQQGYELPDTATSAGGTVYVAWAAEGAPTGANLYISDDGVTYNFLTQAEPYPTWGRFGTALGAGGGTDSNIPAYLEPNSMGYTQWRQDYLPDVTASGRGDGESRLWVGSEMMSYEGLTVVGSNAYTLDSLFRGWSGTQVSAHNSGALFTQHNLSIQIPYDAAKVGRTFYFKVAPYNRYGVAVDITSVSAAQYTILGTAFAPKAPSQPSWVQSGTDYRGTTTWKVDTPGDITIAWKDTSKVGGYGYFGYDLDPANYGGFAADPTSSWWRVEVYGSGNVLVHSEVVANSFFTYSNTVNIAENGAWRGKLGFRLYHRNSYGDNPSYAVLSLNLFT